MAVLPAHVATKARRLAYTSSLDIIGRAIARASGEAPKIRDLNHYTSLEVLQYILSTDDVRLGHAEYSNDQVEIVHSRQQIRGRINNLKNTVYADEIRKEYESKAQKLDAYVFCMSEGGSKVGAPQDMLSQWRAYGADGRGGCATLSHSRLAELSTNLLGLQLHRVIYSPTVQISMIDYILNDGEAQYRKGVNDAVEITASALEAITPIMKTEGFQEELEWRLIFIPPPGVNVEIFFHPRRDFLAPYVKLRDLITSYRNSLLESVIYREDQVGLADLSKVTPLLPVSEIMIGPSGNQELSRRTFEKVISKTGLSIGLTVSDIKYRSLN